MDKSRRSIESLAKYTLKDNRSGGQRCMPVSEYVFGRLQLAAFYRYYRPDPANPEMALIKAIHHTRDEKAMRVRKENPELFYKFYQEWFLKKRFDKYQRCK